jgi:hypothetical protein
MLVALSRDSRWVGWTWPMWPCTGPEQEVMERDRQAGRVVIPGPGPRLRVLHSVRLASASLCSARLAHRTTEPAASSDLHVVSTAHHSVRRGNNAPARQPLARGQSRRRRREAENTAGSKAYAEENTSWWILGNGSSARAPLRFVGLKTNPDASKRK